MKKILLLSLFLVGCSSPGTQLRACVKDDCVDIYKYSTPVYCQGAKDILSSQFPPGSLDCK